MRANCAPYKTREYKPVENYDAPLRVIFNRTHYTAGYARDRDGKRLYGYVARYEYWRHYLRGPFDNIRSPFYKENIWQTFKLFISKLI